MNQTILSLLAAVPQAAAELPGNSATTSAWWIAPVAALLALGMAALLYKLMKKAPTGNERMEEIAGFVRDGAMAYLKQKLAERS